MSGRVLHFWKFTNVDQVDKAPRRQMKRCDILCSCALRRHAILDRGGTIGSFCSD